MDDLVNDLRKLIEPVHKLVDEATSYIEPDVYDILSKRITGSITINGTADTATRIKSLIR